MRNDRAIPGVIETVLARGGTTARINGARLQVVRGRTTWTVPLRACRSADLTADGSVRVELSGSPDGATHGLGAAVELPSPNPRAAEAFLGQLAAALAATEPAADGHGLVRVETRAGLLGRTTRHRNRIETIVLRLGLYVPALFVLGWLSPQDREGAVISLTVAGVCGAVGGFVLLRVARRVRSLWLLRGRGIGVVGQVTGFVRIWDKGAHLWQFSKVTYTTMDGQRMTDVVSVVTAWGFSKTTFPGAAVELNYDPERPTRASRPLTVGFAFRTLLLATAGAVPAWVFVLCVSENLPF